MRTRVPLLAALGSCFVFAACTPPAEQAEPSGGEVVSTEADEAAIRGLMDRWTDGLNAKVTATDHEGKLVFDELMSWEELGSG